MRRFCRFIPKRLGDKYEERGDCGKRERGAAVFELCESRKNADAELAAPGRREVKRRLARLSDIERPSPRD
jgi:hypothetical protein